MRLDTVDRNTLAVSPTPRLEYPAKSSWVRAFCGSISEGSAADSDPCTPPGLNVVPYNCSGDGAAVRTSRNRFDVDRIGNAPRCCGAIVDVVAELIAGVKTQVCAEGEVIEAFHHNLGVYAGIVEVELAEVFAADTLRRVLGNEDVLAQVLGVALKLDAQRQR